MIRWRCSGIPDRPQQITFAEMRETTATAIRLRSAAMAGRLIFGCPNSEARFVCRACGKRGADVRPDFNLE